jgi:hypothetical protein
LYIDVPGDWCAADLLHEGGAKASKDLDRCEEDESVAVPEALSA